MNQLTISSKLGKILFYLFNIIWYVPLLLSIFSVAIHLPIYFSRISNRDDGVNYLQDTGMLAYSSSTGGGTIDYPNIYLFLSSIFIIFVFVIVNLVMTYRRTSAKWFLFSILALYTIFTIGLYSLELISF